MLVAEDDEDGGSPFMFVASVGVVALVMGLDVIDAERVFENECDCDDAGLNGLSVPVGGTWMVVVKILVM